MAELPEPTYNSTQQELYSISDTMNTNLGANMADFAAYKAGKYTALFLTALQGKRTAAMALPDDDQRTSVFETLKVGTTNARIKCTNNFDDLRGFIDDGFSDELRKIKYEEAGGNYMRDALKNNWEKVVGLNTAMVDFVALYPAQLTAGFMPPPFGGSVSTDEGTFNTKYTAFKNARQTGVATGAKITANNLVDTDLKDLQRDAQKVYRTDGDKLKLFTISVVKDLVSPPGSASLKITCKQKVTNVPKVGLVITIQSKDGVAIVLTTDANGVVVFENIDPADYNVVIVVLGFPNIVKVKEVNTGVAARMEVETD